MFGWCVICSWYIGRNVNRLKLLNSTPAAVFIFYLVGVSPEFGIVCVCVCVYVGGGVGVVTVAGVFGRSISVTSAFGILGEMLIS